MPWLLLIALLPLAAVAQQPADGGPWAPVVIDPATAKIEPAVIAPGEAAQVTLQVRPEHRDRIRDFSLRTNPALWEGQAETTYDPADGVLHATIPAGAMKLEGAFDVRLELFFEWTDGQVKHRSPSMGTLIVRRFKDAKPDPGALQAARVKASDAAVALRMGGEKVLADVLAARADQVQVAPAADGPTMAAAISALEGLASLADEPYGAAASRLLARAWVTNHPALPVPPLTVMVGGEELTDDILKLFRESGLNAVVHADPGQAERLRENGFTPSSSRAPARWSDDWATAHPSDRLERYVLSQPATAESAVLAIDLMSPYQKHGLGLDADHDPAKYWRVYDRTDDTTLPPDSWRVEGEQVRVASVAGHVYQVAFLVYMGGQSFFNTVVDPIHPAAREHLQEGAKRHLSRLAPDGVYRPTSLYYPFPKLDAGSGLAQWNWWGYQWGACPAAQEQFTADTGVPFDPGWITEGGRYGHINYPPAPEYLAWMRWQQQNVNRWTKELVDRGHARGVRTRVFWGDHWIGAEPYGDFFEQSGADGLVKACNSGVVSRSVSDLPGDAEGVIRFSPWLNWGELFRHDHPVGRMQTVWADIRQGALRNMPDGLTWGGSTIASLQDPQIGGAMRDITADFEFLSQTLHGKQAYQHPITLYVANSWGRLRSWAGWGQLNPSTDVLDALCWLPIEVKFISLREIAEAGVPADASVILNAGEPGSAWSGGRDWADPNVADAIARFVQGGGGLIGIDAPSHLAQDNGPTFRLASELGIDFDRFTSPQAELGVWTHNDAARLQKALADWHGDATRVGEHWLGQSLPELIPGLQASVFGKPVGQDVAIVYRGSADDGAPPMVTARDAGQGRAVWIGGFAKSAEFAALLRRAIFWSAKQEALLQVLDSAPLTTRTYLYPSERLLIVFQPAAEDVDATVRCDPELLDAQPAAQYRLVDILHDRPVATVSAQQMRDGFGLPLAGRTARVLRVEAVER